MEQNQDPTKLIYVLYKLVASGKSPEGGSEQEIMNFLSQNSEEAAQYGNEFEWINPEDLQNDQSFMEFYSQFVPQDNTPQYAKNGAKLKKLQELKKGGKAKKCSCGCDLITVKEDGGKLTSKCACNCKGGKMKKHQEGGEVTSSKSQLGVAKNGKKLGKYQVGGNVQKYEHGDAVSEYYSNKQKQEQSRSSNFWENVKNTASDLMRTGSEGYVPKTQYWSERDKRNKERLSKYAIKPTPSVNKPQVQKVSAVKKPNTTVPTKTVANNKPAQTVKKPVVTQTTTQPVQPAQATTQVTQAVTQPVQTKVELPITSFIQGRFIPKPDLNAGFYNWDKVSKPMDYIYNLNNAIDFNSSLFQATPNEYQHRSFKKGGFINKKKWINKK